MNSKDNLQFDVQFFPGTEIKGSHCYQYDSFILKSISAWVSIN